MNEMRKTGSVPYIKSFSIVLVIAGALALIWFRTAAPVYTRGKSIAEYGLESSSTVFFDAAPQNLEDIFSYCKKEHIDPKKFNGTLYLLVEGAGRSLREPVCIWVNAGVITHINGDWTTVSNKSKEDLQGSVGNAISAYFGKYKWVVSAGSSGSFVKTWHGSEVLEFTGWVTVFPETFIHALWIARYRLSVISGRIVNVQKLDE